MDDTKECCKRKILIVDDEKNMRETIKSILQDEGYQVSTAESGETALRNMEEALFSIMIADLKMPRMDGVELLRRAKKINPEMEVLMITAYPTVATAVEAMKQGAYDYIVKPFNPEEIILTIKKVIEHQRVLEENRRLREELASKYQLKDIISVSAKMKAVHQLVRMVAPTPSTILIEGESGTGKELIAHAVHSLSPRRRQPFVSVNCAAIPGELLESELFGHEKGAFTGAIRMKQGKFEIAHQGTIYLDEVADMSPHLQAKILRVLQEREFERVGATKTIQVDVRIIAATNRDLKKEMQEGEFREDLYYRLNVIRIHLPPLRERRDDVPLLVEHFLKKYAEIRAMGGEIEVAPKAMNLLMGYDWPGNVRELENAVERALILSKGEVIKVDSLPPEITAVAPSQAEGRTLEVRERQIIMDELERTGGDQQKAAKNLGIARNTLWRKVKKYNLQDFITRLQNKSP